MSPIREERQVGWQREGQAPPEPRLEEPSLQMVFHPV